MKVRALIVMAAAMVAAALSVTTTTAAPFKWGGMTIHPQQADDRGRFAVWLDDRAVLHQWTHKHPVLASRLGRYWPPSHETVRRAVRDVFSQAGPLAVSIALCITDRESGDYWRAYSATDDAGPFQGNIIHWGDGSPSVYTLYDPLGAARWAFGLSRGGTSFTAWRGGRWSCGLGS